MHRSTHRIPPFRSLARAAALAVGVLALGCVSVPSSSSSSQIQPVVVKEGKDSPEISRSKGQPGGVVVLWPRIIPRTEDPETIALAEQVQAELTKLAEKALPDRPTDVRPQPERVCPRAGCEAMTVGAVVTRKGDGCAVVATVGGSGPSSVRLVGWAGTTDIRQDVVAFRDPPESQIVIKEYATCDGLMEALAEKAGDVEAAMKDVALAE